MLIALFESGLHILLMLPLILWGRQKNRAANLRPVGYFIFIYIATNALISGFSHVILFKGQQWNWVGKGLALLWGLLLLRSIPGFTPGNFRATKKINWSGTRPLLIVCLIYLLIRIALYVFSGEAEYSINSESLLYQATLPGIQEEIIFRGILLGLLTVVFKRPCFKLLNTYFALATIITSLLFGLSHGLSLSEGFIFHFNAVAFARSSFDGFLFALLVKKTKSIIPSIAFHNLLNVIGDH